jgi:hypothetical protein
MLVACSKYQSIADVSSSIDITAYKKFVTPINYDFCIDKNVNHIVFGTIEWDGTPWIYVVPVKGDMELSILPAILFSFKHSEIPSDMILRVTQNQKPSFEILPKSLAEIDHWFERYVDEEKEIVDIVNNEINRLRKLISGFGE